MFSTRSSTYALVALLAAAPAFSQDMSYGLHVIQSRPQGEMASHVGRGYGANGTFLLRADSMSILSVRADLGVLQYGNDTRDVTIGDAAADGLRLELRTSNYIVPFTIGLQLAAPTGMVRPYVNAGAGFQAYFTETTLSDKRGYVSFASTTNQADFVASASVGGGVYVPIIIRSKTLMFDAGAQYLQGGRASYLTSDSITSGSTTLTPLKSDAHVVVIKLGASLQW
jgi:hypothetical protein